MIGLDKDLAVAKVYYVYMTQYQLVLNHAPKSQSELIKYSLSYNQGAQKIDAEFLIGSTPVNFKPRVWLNTDKNVILKLAKYTNFLEPRLQLEGPIFDIYIRDPTGPIPEIYEDYQSEAAKVIKRVHKLGSFSFQEEQDI